MNAKDTKQMLGLLERLTKVMERIGNGLCGNPKITLPMNATPLGALVRLAQLTDGIKDRMPGRAEVKWKWGDNHEVAAELGVDIKTVKNYRRELSLPKNGPINLQQMQQMKNLQASKAEKMGHGKKIRKRICPDPCPKLFQPFPPVLQPFSNRFPLNAPATVQAC